MTAGAVTATPLTAEQTRLVEQHLGLVPKVIKRRMPRCPDSDFDDRVTDGYFGLIRAARLFDPANGTPFSGFAWDFIWRAVLDGISRFEGKNYRRAQDEREPFVRALSIDAPNLDGRTYADYLAAHEADEVDIDPTAGTPAMDAAYQACISAFQLSIVLGIEDGLSLEQIAEHLGVTGENVRQHKVRIVRRARQIKENAMTMTTLNFTCPECSEQFDRAAALGSHRRYKHEVGATESNGVKPKAAAAPKGEVIVQLVDEEPPPPPAPKRKPIDAILSLVEENDLSDGAWKRAAVFPSGRAAKAMAARLRKIGPGYEWTPADDGRLFVRVAAVA